MKQSVLIHFFKKPTAVSGNAMPTARVSTENVSIQSRPSTIRKATDSADSLGEYEQPKKLRAFQPGWLGDFGWLRLDKVNGLMYCIACREFEHLVPTGLRTLIDGDDKYRRWTLVTHGRSKNHSKCMDAYKAKEEPQESPLAILQRKMSAKQREQYSILFNTAYQVAMRNWSFRDFEAACRLQLKNGLLVGDNYMNTHGCRDFIDSIAHVQRLETIKGLTQCRFFSLRADGSTDRSIAEQEAVYVRYVVNGEPVNKFIGLEEVEQSTSDRTLAAIDNSLATYAGVSMDMQKEKLVNINLDGAPVNMGVHNGVGVLQQRRIGDWVTVTHCVNHNLELAILDLRKDEPYLASFETTLKGIFSFYNYSPKRVRELEQVAAVLEESLAHFGGIQQIRWVASQRRALKALLKNYVATCTHFADIAASKDRGAVKAKALLKKLQSPKFLTFLHFMVDFTEVLGCLSEAFQADDLMVMEVLPEVEAVMWHLEEMKTSPGKCVSSLTNGKEYKGVSLSGEVHPELDQLHLKLLSSAIDHLDCRFSALQKPPLSDFAVLNYSKWPYEKKDLAAFGNEEIGRLVQHFSPVLTEKEVDAIPMQWMNFKNHLLQLRTSDPKVVYRDLLVLQPKNIIHVLPLIEIMLTHSMSTAIVERGFSHMNIIKGETRTLLGNETLNNLLELKINGPTFEDFSPVESIIYWIDKSQGTRHINGHRL